MRNLFALAALTFTALNAAPAAAQADWTANTTSTEVSGTVPAIREFKGFRDMTVGYIVQGTPKTISLINAGALAKDFRYNAPTLLTVAGPATLSDGAGQSVNASWDCGLALNGGGATGFDCVTGRTFLQPAGTREERVLVGVTLTPPADLKPGLFKGTVTFNAAPAGS